MDRRTKHDLTVMAASAVIGLGASLLTLRVQDQNDRALAAAQTEEAQLNALRDASVRAMQNPWDDASYFELDRRATASQPYQGRPVREALGAFVAIVNRRRQMKPDPKEACVPTYVVNAFVALTNSITDQVSLR